MRLSPNQKRKNLRQLMCADETLIAPGIYDAYGLRLVQQAGFQAAYMTGNGVSAALLGVPDVGQVDLTLIADHARRVVSCADIPVICDADTGYGGLLNIQRTIREFEAAGVAAIHIEDQVFPKRCAQFSGARQVLDAAQALAHIEAAVASRVDQDFIIIARTDSAASLGLDEAIQRAQMFTRAGADAVFIELKAHPEVILQLQKIRQELDACCLFNIDVGGPISELRSSELKALGVDIAIHPNLARGVFGFAMQTALQHMKTHQMLHTHREHMLTPQQYNHVLGLAEIESWEQQFDPHNKT